jgi:hypothetical protein
MGDATYPVKDRNTTEDSGLQIVSYYAHGMSWTIRADVSAEETLITVGIPMPPNTA